jgi:hypothetical protein
MKRYIISFLLIFATWQAANAMSYERAREEALYLTDKMAYELNLNDQQYNDAYEINLDYFLSLNSEADLYGDYLSYRLSDFRHILCDWQYSIMLAADYFIRPVYWRSNGWYFPIYTHYNHGYFYYSYPTVYYSYRGGHGRIYHYNGYYADRRPAWNGGLRGNQPIAVRTARSTGRSSFSSGRGRRINGDGYHIDIPDRGNNRTDRGNSFSNSSSRNSRYDYSVRGDYGKNKTTVNPRGYNGTENRSARNYDTNRYNENTRNYNHNRDFGGSRNTSTSRGYYSSPSTLNSRGSVNNSRYSESNRSYNRPSVSNPGRGGFNNPSSSRRGFSDGSRGGFSGGSRGGSSGGSVSRGRR